MLRALLTTLILLLPTTLVGAPIAYALEVNNSEVGFIFKLNRADARGNMPIKSSTVVIDPNALERSSVDVTVDVRKARTGFIFATEALKAPSVLNARDHGTIRFTSTRIRLNGAGRLADGAKIDGNLTIRGITKPVTLNAALFRQRGSEAGDLSRLSFRLNGEISRSAFGVTGYPDLVDDKVRLDIVARVNR